MIADQARWTRKDLADPGACHPFTVTAAKPDNALSISSEVIRCVHEGRRAVVVPGTGPSRSSYTKPQIDALVDLLHLYRCTAPPEGVTVTSELDIILGGARPEASDALFTLVRSLKTSDAVKLSSRLGKFFSGCGERDGFVVTLAGCQAVVQAAEQAAEQVALGGGVPVSVVAAPVVVGAGAG